MTREEAKQNVFLHTGMDAIEYYSSGFVDGVWILRTDVINFINKIFDEHEADIKDKDKEIERLENRVYALENDTIVQNMEQRLIDISLVINGKLTSKDNA